MKRQKSILVVDDDKVFGEAVIELLQPTYEEVKFCSSALDAKELLTARPFSLVISDLQMPQMTGSEFVRLVRSIGRIEPIIFFTGNVTLEVLFTALRLGVSDVIEKPFDEDFFLQTIDRVIELEKRRIQLYEKMFSEKADGATIESKKKMIGLLQVVNEKK